jgi:hypothetical protein
MQNKSQRGDICLENRSLGNLCTLHNADRDNPIIANKIIVASKGCIEKIKFALEKIVTESDLRAFLKKEMLKMQKAKKQKRSISRGGGK